MRNLYDIWEDKAPLDPNTPWRAKLVNYTAEFPTQTAAKGFVESVKEYRKQQGLK